MGAHNNQSSNDFGAINCTSEMLGSLHVGSGASVANVMSVVPSVLGFL